MHEEKEDKGARQFEALPPCKKEILNKESFIEGFVYGIIDSQQIAFKLEQEAKKN